MKENPLIGKTIASVEIASDKKAIRFLLSDCETVTAKADADCCSGTWIEHLSLPAGGLPALVLKAEKIEMPDLGTPEDFECLKYYGFQITTDKGHMLIDYRNESNGYYGGDLIWPGEYFYGGVHGQNISNEDWKKIDRDF
jgi:hypothetical protein